MHDNEPCKECVELELKKWCDYHKANEMWSECAEKQEIE